LFLISVFEWRRGWGVWAWKARSSGHNCIKKKLFSESLTLLTSKLECFFHCESFQHNMIFAQKMPETTREEFSGVEFRTLHFFATYERAQKARVFHYTRLERSARGHTLAYWPLSQVMKKWSVLNIASDD
jgi:hypothetical protein